MTPEQIKSYCAEEWRTITAECTTDSMALLQLFAKLAEERKQLQAEKARADKAEEMVAVMREAAEKVKHWHDGHMENGNKYMTVAFDSVVSLWEATEQTDIVAQAHNKRKCDEIVGKLKISFGKLMPGESRKEFDLISKLLDTAIDIVKSVLLGDK